MGITHPKLPEFKNDFEYGRNGCYDYRTFVFASETIDGFGKSAPITMLNAHAPEFVCDANGDWYMLSVFYPENGISAFKIKWV